MISSKSFTPAKDNQGNLTLWLFLSTLAVTVGSSFQFGYNTGVLTGVSNSTQEFYILSYYDRKGEYLSEDSLRWLWSTTVSIYAIGGAFGALIAGYLSDVLGRKGALILNNVFSVSASLMFGLSQVANSYVMVIMGRIVIGFSVGISITIVPLYLAEISPINLRGAIGTCHQLAITVGILIAQVLGLYPLNDEDGWPLCLALTGVFGMGGCLILLICPESPRWLLINRGDEEKAREAMQKLRGCDNVEIEINEMKEEHRKSQEMDEDGKISMLDVLRLKESWWKMPLIISVFLHAGQQFSGINAVMFYATEIYTQAGMEDDAIALATVGTGLVNVLMTIVAVYIVDRTGRRVLMLYPYAAMIFITAIITLSLSLDGDAWQWVTLAFIYLYIIGFAIGPGPMPFVVVPELWAQGPRPAAMSIAVQCNWWSTFIIGLAFPFMQAGIGAFTFLVFTFFLALTTAFTYFVVPETKNKTFEEITAKFKSEAEKVQTGAELHEI
ncbi:solute carrier family 2, facilitated glucose transporter member 5-like [Antedon mediterranea]|uniref:solute carrier family 2, facilitated glucose transporter member 5-like n=1 Tax=Antedon mediterranea TaxID=105859 RepID=UPI003AF67D7D